MTRKRLGVLLSLAFVATSSGASAQITNAGDQDPGGRVYARVIVTMTGESGSFGHPASGVAFLVVQENGDRISIRTNDAGVASTWLFPGSYRFVTPDPFAWDGNAYTWDGVVAIKPGTGPIRFSQANASKVAALGPTPTRNVVGVRGNQAPTAPGQIPFQYKDGTTATLLSLVITGGGQMYSGEVGRGFVMLGIGVGAIVFGYVASNCDAYSCDSNGPITAGYVAAISMWLYSLIDAHNAAARHNALAPQAAASLRVEPIGATGADRSTKLGVALKF